MAYIICGKPEQYQITLHCEVLHDIRAIKKYNEFNKKKKSFVSRYFSHLNLAIFLSLKLTATNSLMWETHESYHHMKVRLLVPMGMAKSLNQT